MRDVAIISTSINARPEAYAAWAKAGELIVAGDRNSPPELASFVNRTCHGTYLTPTQQERWHVSSAIGWNCIQRRNVALLEALSQGFQYVVTVDDDNWPQPDGKSWVAGHADSLGSHRGTTVTGRRGFLNTGDLCHPPFHQRGVPRGVDVRPVIQPMHNDQNPTYVVVSQAQVLGDPDCDAVERIARAPEVVAVITDAVVTPGTYAAFNSQATMWTRKWAPVMACLPYVGRYDDILASLIFARLGRVYDATLHVGLPTVRQRRNSHDLSKDLRAELWGMNRVFDICRALDDAYVSNSMPLWMAWSELIYALRDILPHKTEDFATRWVEAWKELLG